MAIAFQLSTARNCAFGLIVAAIAADAASAQITVPVTAYVDGTATGSFQPSPNAAYSNITASPNANSGTVGIGLLPTSFDDVTVPPSLQGQTVRQLRVPLLHNSSIPNPPTNTLRVLVGFWNADGPNGLAGAPLLNVNGTAAHYQSEIVDAPRISVGLWTLDLGEAGFVIPSGRFFVGLSLDTTSNPSANVIWDFRLMNYAPPTVGTTQPGFYQSSIQGIPWGQPLQFPGAVPVATQGPGIELVVPAPSSAVALMLSCMFTCRRRRSR